MHNIAKFLGASAFALAAYSASAAAKADVRKDASSVRPATAQELLATVKLPYDSFTLANGLRVIVNSDSKTPVVTVSVWYGIGSKYESAGHTGFAHLFEHLMFNGSENVPGDFYVPLRAMGSTGMNGGTNYDFTYYYESVPTAGLDRTLFMEADRMGHLLGAVTQNALDQQRGVVQNEKRQGDTAPFGMASYATVAGIYPSDHPYGHSVIGSMADLDKASLNDVRGWFKSHYGPNNAVLVLSGDVTVATARQLVERHFAAIPRGPDTRPVSAPVPVLDAARSATIKDTVPNTLVRKSWPIPGLDNTDEPALEAAAAVLGQIEGNRLYKELAIDHPLTEQTSAEVSAQAQGGVLNVAAMVKEGIDPAEVERHIDAVVTRFLAEGPTEAELARVTVGNTVAMMRSLENTEEKASFLGYGQLVANNPVSEVDKLRAMAALTPTQVRDVARRWLSRPAFTLKVVPGTRDGYEEAISPVEVAAAPPKPIAATATAIPLPPIGTMPALNYPAIIHTTLSNGIRLDYARRDTAPMTDIALSFEAGAGADGARRGTQSLALSVLTGLTARRDTQSLGIAKGQLGAEIGSRVTQDATIFRLDTPSANLCPSLALLAEMLREPNFDSPELKRLRSELGASIAQNMADPRAIADRKLVPLLYGSEHPYAGLAGSDPKVVAALQPAELATFRARWLRPDNARLFVVSDRPLSDVRATLETAFGSWKMPGTPGRIAVRPSAPATARIVLVDRPGSPQSQILGAFPTPLTGLTGMQAEEIGNRALGGDFTARLNMDLRETRHWTYGVNGSFDKARHAAPYTVQTSVQTDKTGAALAALRDDISEFVGVRPITPQELQTAISSSVNQLPNSFGSRGELLSAMQTNVRYGRADDYYVKLAGIYRGLKLDQVRAAMKRAIDPSLAIWVVVGDAAKVRPQLTALGLPVVEDSSDAAPKAAR